jgi:hypothetical protein
MEASNGEEYVSEDPRQVALRQIYLGLPSASELIQKVVKPSSTIISEPTTKTKSRIMNWFVSRVAPPPKTFDVLTDGEKAVAIYRAVRKIETSSITIAKKRKLKYLLSQSKITSSGRELVENEVSDAMSFGIDKEKAKSDPNSIYVILGLSTGTSHPTGIFSDDEDIRAGIDQKLFEYQKAQFVSENLEGEKIVENILRSYEQQYQALYGKD